MGCTVFAENMGWFHQSSNGQGIAPGDVCLTPPPPPAGPIPVPYVNMLFASDLSKGSKSVKADGSPTALEDASEISTSTGNEPGQQGGGVVTHKTKGKGQFTLWSFTVKVEGKGVCRHGDTLLQNEASKPPNCTAPGALVILKNALGDNYRKKTCPEPYDSDKHRPAINQKQEDAVYGKKCWECARQIRRGKKPKTPGGRWMRPKGYEKEYGEDKRKIYENRDRKRMTPDHQPPLNRAWELGGCFMKPSPGAFKELMAKPEMVRPHCRAHSNSQGSKVSAIGDAIRDKRA